MLQCAWVRGNYLQRMVRTVCTDNGPADRQTPVCGLNNITVEDGASYKNGFKCVATLLRTSFTDDHPVDQKMA